MKTSMAAYKRGVFFLHNLMDMLHVALVEVMPSVELERSGAYGWRGYKIRNYQGRLAYGHYFCQLYPDNPTVLLMEEYYNYGGFFYPWRVDLDLIQTHFFECNADGQKAILVNFYTEAVNEALEWQVSPKRKSIVPVKMLMDQEYKNTAHFDYPKAVHHVSIEYKTALDQQSALLSSVKELIEDELTNTGLPGPYIIGNTSGWKYRGLWVKLRTTEPENVIPEGDYPFKFKIDLFDHPEYLRFESVGINKVLDLEDNYYFSLDKSNQEGTLREFLNPIIQHIKEFN